MSKSNFEPSKIVDDIAQLAGGAAGLLSGVQQQIRDDITARVEEMATRLDLVPREDFDRLEGMLKKSLETQKEMMTRIEQLEAKAK